MFRRARFIWTPRQPIATDVTFGAVLRDGPVRRDDGTNRWFLFRRVFSLPDLPDKGELSITVDGRYQLFVNGERVGRGPCRATPEYQRYDVHDIAPYLTGGDNVIAVLVHVYAVDTAWYETAKTYWQSIFGDGGLYCDASISCGAGVVDVLSDESWRCVECDAWRRDVPRSGWGQDFIEDFDANKLPEGWTLPGFDDSGWDRAKVQRVEGDKDDRAKGWGPIEPFPTLIKREIPFLTEVPVAPRAVIATYGVMPAPDLPIDRRIYDETYKPLPDGLVIDANACLAPDDSVTTIMTASDCDAALVFVFDKRHAGFPFIEIEASGGEVLELAVAETIPGEYSGSPIAEPRLQRETYLDCAHLFRYTARPGVQRFEKFEWTAVRYLQLVVRNAPAGLRIRHVGSLATEYPAEDLGAFECSDPMLTNLWEVGRYTTRLCTHDGWEDCPSREKRQWIGDGLVHYLIGAAAFGPSTQTIDRNFLIQGMESQRPDGLLEMFTPGDHHRDGIIIPDFSLHWIEGVRHYYLHTGDRDTLFEVFPAIERVIAWFTRHIGDRGLLADIPHWHFIEWANVGRRGIAAIINAMFVGALKSAAFLAGHLAYGEAERRYRNVAERMSRALNTLHWDQRRDIYVDVVDPETGAQLPSVSQHANAALILWGVAPEGRWPRMIERIMDSKRLKMTAAPPIALEDEPFDPEEDVIRANTYFSHFLYSALAVAGRFDLAIGDMAAFYGPMLETGTETLWEGFEPSASMCHAFSATAVHQLSAHSLGVQPIEPGFGRFLLAVQPGQLQWVKGVYPSVLGDISVTWEKDGSDLSVDITVPDGSEVLIRCPPGFASVDELAKAGAGHHCLRFQSV